MEELEERGFRDSLVVDREFWHFKMMEDDYDIELWNPVLTFYQKSPDSRYISQGNGVGKFDMMYIADVIDKYGWLMTEEQMLSLEQLYPIRSAGYLLNGPNDGSFYDSTQSHEWNTNQPSLQMRKYMAIKGNTDFSEHGDVVQWILNQSDNFLDYNFSKPAL